MAWWKKLKSLLKIKRKKLRREIKDLRKKLQKNEERLLSVEGELLLAKEEQANPLHVVEKILGEKQPWFNYLELPYNDRVLYRQNAKALLENPVFNNESNCLFEVWMKYALTKTKSFEEIYHLRLHYNAITLLKERAEQVVNDEKVESLSEERYSYDEREELIKDLLQPPTNASKQISVEQAEKEIYS